MYLITKNKEHRLEGPGATVICVGPSLALTSDRFSTEEVVVLSHLNYPEDESIKQHKGE